ncbi:hypothetical protein RN001_009293 [Aquatica leii]|uniref:Uncharacterized protein n=1 Tax=Aquatica leii TaxID=1421715 RepID=A0AAN7PV90_9COLE|nr:hypothetical protein RN001_009293 [Aquatica leii]
MDTEIIQVVDPEKESSVNSEENLGDLEEEEACFQDIVLLLEHGIAHDDLKRLKAAGINTIKGVQMTIRKKLSEIKGFDDAKIDRIKNACKKISLANGFTTALDVVDQRKQIFKLTTGSQQLDKLLGGGIESMAITEVFGEFGTGKTQLSHTLCVTAQMPGHNGYIGGRVIFIDTEHTFRPDRLRPIADRFNLDQTTVLDNVLYARAYNSEHQYELLDNVVEKLHEEAGLFKLLIVDSVMALFRVDYCGRGEIAVRQQKLGQMMSRLQKISEEYNIAVFMTNQITSDLNNLEQPDVQKPVGGNILAHASTTRICFHKNVKGNRIAKVYDSPELEECEVAFAITSGGIDDVKDVD